MGLEDRMKAKMNSIIHQQSDSSLTASELRRKYDEPADGPPSPRLKATSTTYSRTIQMSLVASTRCWACATALHDPGASFFACGACGAFNGEEPRQPHQPFDSTPWRLVCRRAAQRGRLAAATTALVLKVAIAQLLFVLLPRLMGSASSWSATALAHLVAILYIAINVSFNLAATLASGPGYVTDEHTPLGASGSGRESFGGDAEGGGGTELSRLKAATDDDMPLRGWRQSAETGLSVPPRAHYCRTCRKDVLRMDHHCALLNTCIGHRNHHYYLRLLASVSAAGVYMAVGASCMLRAAGGDMVAPAGGNTTGSAGAAADASASALVLTFGVGVALVVAAGPLLVWQLRNLLRGLTHIESLKAPPPLDYDLGWRENVRVAFSPPQAGAGAGLLWWRLVLQALPLPSPPGGDGLRWTARPPPRRV